MYKNKWKNLSIFYEHRQLFQLIVYAQNSKELLNSTGCVKDENKRTFIEEMASAFTNTQLSSECKTNSWTLKDAEFNSLFHLQIVEIVVL
jgi:hypothetical protein